MLYNMYVNLEHVGLVPKNPARSRSELLVWDLLDGKRILAMTVQDFLYMLLPQYQVDVVASDQTVHFCSLTRL